MAKDTTTPANPPKRSLPTPGVRVEGTFAEPWKPADEGDTITGLYLGSQEVKPPKRESFIAYHIRTDDEPPRRMSVSGAGLNQMMSQIPTKTNITITFEGKQDTQNGPMKLFTVLVPPGTILIDPFDTAD